MVETIGGGKHTSLRPIKKGCSTTCNILGEVVVENKRACGHKPKRSQKFLKHIVLKTNKRAAYKPALLTPPPLV